MSSIGKGVVMSDKTYTWNTRDQKSGIKWHLFGDLEFLDRVVFMNEHSEYEDTKDLTIGLPLG